jgi:two-component system phosphate regulon sensor histidine kinase PhoR
MLRSGFFWRVYLAFSAIVLLTGTVIGLLVVRQIGTDFEEQIAARLRNEAAALIPIGYRAFLEGFDSQQTVENVGRDSGTRVTIVRIDGLVLADSEERPERMDNHATRPEIVEAIETGAGSAKRFSDTVRRNLMYVAVRLTQGGEPLGVVRVALPLAQIDAEIGLVRREIIRGTVLGILVALALSVFVARRVAGPIAEMTQVSDALQREDYSVRVVSPGPAEIGTLGENLNRLADRLLDRMATLSHQQAQIGAIIRSMEEGVLAIDARRQIIASNAVGRSLLGVPDDHDAALSDKFLASAPEVAKLIEAVESGGAAHREIVLSTESGDVVLDARATPFSTDQDQGVILVLYNISNLRRLERVRTDFVANVSHELKTPLTSIQGYVETLLDGAIDDVDNNVRFLEKIRGHVRRLTALVSDLLSLARIESPSAMLARETIDWRDIVTESAQRRTDSISSRRLRMEIELPEHPVLVVGDREAMRQVTDNLLDNAINYTGEGGSIRVEVRATDALGCVCIEDTGIGVPADALDRIFERFYRVDRGRSRELGGTGLGLSIVRNLLSRMNGTVTVESTVGVGSTFTVSLPAAPPPDPGPDAAAS